MGFGLGCLGLSFADWCALSPAEFAATCRAYREEQEFATRDAWERMRLLAAVTIQPHVKNKLTPQKLFALPWDDPRNEERGRRNKKDEEPPPPMSAEEQKKRFAELVGKVSRR